jgi:hypothetical protein
MGSQTSIPNVNPMMKTMRKRGVRASERSSFSTRPASGSRQIHPGKR